MERYCCHLIRQPVSEVLTLSKSGNYRGITLVSLGSKLLSNMILYRQRYAADNVKREEKCSFKRVRGCVDQIFALRLIIEKSLSHQTPFVLSFIDYSKRSILLIERL